MSTSTYKVSSKPANESLSGVVERLTYHSPESGYTVARLKDPRVSELITIVGNFANIQAGQTLQLKGTWGEHPKYGSQFQVVDYKESLPATITGIEKYLGSGLIKGVGPVTAKRIVAHFGLETLDVIEHHIERLIEVPGIAKKRIAMIQHAWEQQKAIKDVMVFLQGHGVSTIYAVKIFKQYGNNAIATVTHNPYQLAVDIYSIGFLTAEVFRQAASSGIVRAAHQINRGQYPQLEPISMKPTMNCLWHSGGTEPEHGVQTVCELIEHFLPQTGFNPATDVQVLCPMTRGIVGTRNFNRVLQQLINPPSEGKDQLIYGSLTLRVGDRVMQQKNDYHKEVFNGDLGIVRAIERTEKEVTIDFDGRDVSYDYADLNEITLAWAISIHKSQGSEYPVVILPLYLSHYVMLSRNLFYTGLTRAKQLAIVIGAQKPIAIAVNQLKQQQRYTRLQQRLSENFL